MLRRPRAFRASASLFALILAAGALLCAPAAFAWPAGEGGDVVLEDFNTTSKDGRKILIKHAEFTNTNLTQDEVAKLLNPDTPAKDQLELVRKLKAEKISIPSIELTPKDGGKVSLHDFSANDIDSGKVGKLTIAGIDGAGAEDGAPITIRSGALVLEDADLAEVLKATGAPDEAAQNGRIGHMKWESVDIVAPDKESGPGKTVHIAFGSFELTSDYDGDMLKKGSTVLKGLVIEPAPGSEFANNLSTLGYSRLELGAVIGAHYEADGKVLSLDDLTLEGAQMGSLGLKAHFGDVDPSLMSGDKSARMQALFGCSIAALEVKIVNAGLFEKAVAYYAKQQGVTPDALKQQISAAAVQMVPVMLGGDPSALKVASEAQKFIAQPKNLTISIKAKGDPLKAADFMGGDPSAITSKLDISATANQ
jgi:hypothetical protein